MTTWLFVDKDGVEWRVSSYGMTRTFRKRTRWIRFTRWVKRVLAIVGLAIMLAGCVVPPGPPSGG